MEPSEISSGCFLAVLERRKDPSETKSVEDILARAAAKGLLDGIFGEKAKEEKEEKKKKRVTQRRRNITGSGREPKTAEILHHQTVSNIKAEVPTSKAVSNIQQKNVTQTTNGCAQLKKSVKLVSGTALPKVLKPPAGKTYLRPIRTERKRIVLKPAKIIFPPPYLDLLGNQPRTTSTQHPFHGWTGAKGSSGRIPPPPPEVGTPSVLSHPRRWL